MFHRNQNWNVETGVTEPSVLSRPNWGKPNPQHRRLGLTIIELLVVIAVIALLSSLVGTAVMSARESARRMQCSSHLKQIGLGIHNYHATHGYLPCSGVFGLRYLSEFVEGQPGNWEFEYCPDPCMSGPCPEVGAWSRPKVYLCPSDSLVHRTKRSASYAFSSGTSHIENGRPGVSDGIGLADIDGTMTRRLGDVTDGTSQTACASEQLIPPIRLTTSREEYVAALPALSTPKDPLRHTWLFSGTYAIPSQLDAMFAECEQSTFAEVHWAGNPFNGRVGPYSHVRTPNKRACNLTSPSTTHIAGPIAPATSLHRGGVNLLLCDGSVRFVSDSIANSAWQSLGTINTGDVVGEW